MSLRKSLHGPEGCCCTCILTTVQCYSVVLMNERFEDCCMYTKLLYRVIVLELMNWRLRCTDVESIMLDFIHGQTLIHQIWQAMCCLQYKQKLPQFKIRRRYKFSLASGSMIVNFFPLPFKAGRKKVHGLILRYQCWIWQINNPVFCNILEKVALNAVKLFCYVLIYR